MTTKPHRCIYCEYPWKPKGYPYSEYIFRDARDRFEHYTIFHEVSNVSAYSPKGGEAKYSPPKGKKPKRKNRHFFERETYYDLPVTTVNVLMR